MTFLNNNSLQTVTDNLINLYGAFLFICYRGMRRKKVGYLHFPELWLTLYISILLMVHVLGSELSVVVSIL